MSGVASPTGNYPDNMNKTLKSTFAEVQRANPGAPPAVLMAALRSRIELMKGVSGEDKAVLQYQVAMAKMQMQHQEDREKIQSASDLLDRKEKELDARTEALNQLKASIAAHHDQTIATVGAGHDAAGVKRAGITANAGIAKTNIQQSGATNRQDMKDKTNLAVTDKKSKTAENVAKTGVEGRTRAATISAGGKDPGESGSSGPPPEAKAMLKKNPTPERKKQFDKVFGEGAANKALMGG
jgi:hypothetical protein